MPQVSVIIPTYNRASFIKQTIESVLAQTYKNYEIIVVDDGSSDYTKEAVESFGNKVRYIYQENKGPAAARNTGIKHAKGKYIAFLDSDDLYLPNKLKKQMDFIKKNPRCRFLYTWYNNVNEKGKVTKLRKPHTCKTREELQYYLFTRKFTIRTSTVLIEKKCFKKSGMFNENYLYSQDWDLWLRLTNYYRGYCLEEPLVQYSLHKSNRSSLSIKKYHPEIKESILKLYGWDKKKLAKLEKKYGKKKKKKGRKSR